MVAQDKLPRPTIPMEDYAYATVMELRRLNATLERIANAFDEITLSPAQEQSEEVELKETSGTKPKKSHRDAKKAENDANSI